MLESDGRLKGVFPKQYYALKGHLTSKTFYVEPNFSLLFVAISTSKKYQLPSKSSRTDNI